MPDPTRRFPDQFGRRTAFRIDPMPRARRSSSAWFWVMTGVIALVAAITLSGLNQSGNKVAESQSLPQPGAGNTAPDTTPNTTPMTPLPGRGTGQAPREAPGAAPTRETTGSGSSAR